MWLGCERRATKGPDQQMRKNAQRLACYFLRLLQRDHSSLPGLFLDCSQRDLFELTFYTLALE